MSSNRCRVKGLNRACCAISRRRFFSTPSKPVTVSTRSRHKVKSLLAQGNTFSVPLTLADVHLRHEQLPFAYCFREKLDAQQLKSSLRRVLDNFPIVGGRINPATFQAIDCGPNDSVPLSFGDINLSLEEWLGESRGHSHVAGDGHPALLPLFDPLFQEVGSSGGIPPRPYDNLLTIRVTFFTCGGTALGVNFLHALGDAASCLRFVQCWGREMQRLSYPPGACNDRSNATVSGMMTEELAEIMGISHDPQETRLAEPSWLESVGFYEWLSPMTSIGENVQTPSHAQPDKEARHEYLQLCFPADLLIAMKEVGMAPYTNDSLQKDYFVSTNDLVTAFGWLLKRSLSGQDNWNISMVVNMRGRGGVDSFTDMDDLATEGSNGLFGNGITNVVVMHPSTTKSFDIWDVTRAARSVRLALQEGISQLPDRLILSKMGIASQNVSTAKSFPTTSWSQFKLKDISFSSNESVAAFQGHPSHPLPVGQYTYSSVIVNALFQGHPGPSDTGKGGIKYNLLLPFDQVEEAKQKHLELCEAFLNAQLHLKRGVANR